MPFVRSVLVLGATICVGAVGKAVADGAAKSVGKGGPSAAQRNVMLAGRAIAVAAVGLLIYFCVDWAFTFKALSDETHRTGRIVDGWFAWRSIAVVIVGVILGTLGAGILMPLVQVASKGFVVAMGWTETAVGAVAYAVHYSGDSGERAEAVMDSSDVETQGERLRENMERLKQDLGIGGPLPVKIADYEGWFKEAGKQFSIRHHTKTMQVELERLKAWRACHEEYLSYVRALQQIEDAKEVEGRRGLQREVDEKKLHVESRQLDLEREKIEAEIRKLAQQRDEKAEKMGDLEERLERLAKLEKKKEEAIKKNPKKEKEIERMIEDERIRIMEGRD